MSEWELNKLNPSDLNEGNKYDENSQFSLESLNKMVESVLYSQNYVEHITDSPDISEANQVGVAEVTMIETVIDGVTYRKLKFKNLKGEKGDTGETGQTGETGPKGDPGVTFNYDAENGILDIITE